MQDLPRLPIPTPPATPFPNTRRPNLGVAVHLPGGRDLNLTADEEDALFYHLHRAPYKDDLLKSVLSKLKSVRVGHGLEGDGLEDDLDVESLVRTGEIEEGEIEEEVDGQGDNAFIDGGAADTEIRDHEDAAGEKEEAVGIGAELETGIVSDANAEYPHGAAVSAVLDSQMGVHDLMAALSVQTPGPAATHPPVTFEDYLSSPESEPQLRLEDREVPFLALNDLGEPSALSAYQPSANSGSMLQRLQADRTSSPIISDLNSSSAPAFLPPPSARGIEPSKPSPTLFSKHASVVELGRNKTAPMFVADSPSPSSSSVVELGKTKSAPLFVTDSSSPSPAFQRMASIVPSHSPSPLPAAYRAKSYEIPEYQGPSNPRQSWSYTPEPTSFRKKSEEIPVFRGRSVNQEDLEVQCTGHVPPEVQIVGVGQRAPSIEFQGINIGTPKVKTLSQSIPDTYLEDPHLMDFPNPSSSSFTDDLQFGAANDEDRLHMSISPFVGDDERRGRSKRRKSLVDGDDDGGNPPGTDPAAGRRLSRRAKKRKMQSAQDKEDQDDPESEEGNSQDEGEEKLLSQRSGDDDDDEEEEQGGEDEDDDDDYSTLKSKSKVSTKEKAAAQRKAKAEEVKKAKVGEANNSKSEGKKGGKSKGKGKSDAPFTVLDMAKLSDRQRLQIRNFLAKLCGGKDEDFATQLRTLRSVFRADVTLETPLPEFSKAEARLHIANKEGYDERDCLHVYRLTRNAIVQEGTVMYQMLEQIITNMLLGRTVTKMKVQGAKRKKESRVLLSSTTLTSIWKAALKSKVSEAKNVCSYAVFHGYVSNGSKWAKLGYAGTIHLVVLLLMRNDKSEVEGMPAKLFDALACSLRDPKRWVDAETCYLIERKLIPRLAEVARVFPITPQNMRVHGHVAPNTWGEPYDPCLGRWEFLFAQVLSNAFQMPERDMDVWGQFCVTAPDVEDSAGSGSEDSAGSDTGRPPTVITSSYVRDLRANLGKPYPGKKGDKEEWDMRERERAEGAKRLDTIESLQEEMNNDKRFPNGVRNWDANYVYLILRESRERILLNDKWDNLLAYVIGNLPDAIRQELHLGLKNSLGLYLQEDLHHRDTREEEKTEYVKAYPTIHFDRWIRYAAKGYEAPPGVHPYFLCREGKSKLNTGQLLLWACSEEEEHKELGESLKIIFAPVFSWIAQQVQELMPEWYEKLTWCLDILPHFEQTIAAPFLGFVVNINVMTRGHRDGKDLEACVVMPIGDFEGGELVLAELGLVVELKNGDVIIFPSHKLTHFNLHYKGTRASFVFHTDASAIKFVEDHNGWTLV